MARRRDERGVTAVLLSTLISLVLLGVASFAVDLGLQRVGRADMQALADMVALDLARELDGVKTAAELEGVEDALAGASRARNQDTLGDTDPELTVDWGEMDAGGQAFTPLTGAAVPTAVRVRAATDVDFVFGGVTGVASGGVARTAVAASTQSACFKVGSFVASLDAAQSRLLNPILNALLGSSLDLDLVGYRRLAGANVSLLDLADVGGLRVGTVQELLELDNLKVADLLEAAAKVLDQQKGLGSVEADLLRTIRAGVSATTPTIAIADLIDVAPGDASALTAGLNVLDLVTTSAFVSNDDHFVDVPDLGISLPGVAAVTTRLSVVEPAQVRCGPVGTTNETAQVRLNLQATIPQLSLPTAITSLINTDVRLDATVVSLDLDLGSSAAELTGVTCNDSGPDSLTVQLRSGVVGSTNIAAQTGVAAEVGIPLSNAVGGLLNSVTGLLGFSLGDLLGLSNDRAPKVIVSAPVNVGASVPGATAYDKTVTIPLPSRYDLPNGSGSGPVIGAVSASTASTGVSVRLRYWDPGLLGGRWEERTLLTTDPLFQSVVDPILGTLLSSVLNPLVATLQTAVVAPLAELLGVQLGGADVFALRTPTCRGPRLRQ